MEVVQIQGYFQREQLSPTKVRGLEGAFQSLRQRFPVVVKGARRQTSEGVKAAC